MNNLAKSFTNEKGGLSARKLSAWAGVMIAGELSLFQLPSDDRLYAVIAWLLFALLCLSIITAEQIIKFKNGFTETKTTVTATAEVKSETNNNPT